MAASSSPDLAELDVGSLLEGRSPKTGLKVSPLADKAPPQTNPGATSKKASVPFLRDGIVTSIFFSTLKKFLGDDLAPQIAQDFRDEVIQECGAAQNPMEAWLVEQAVLLRLTNAYLHAMTIGCRDSKAIALLSSSACQCSAELRRTVLASREFRGKQDPQIVGEDADERPVDARSTCNRKARPCSKVQRKRKAKIVA